MSAPTTNIDRQVSNHRTPIWGILAAVIFGGIMGAAITWTATNNDEVEPTNVQIESTAGGLSGD